MTLSKRTVLVVVSTFIALLFILATSSYVILLKSFASLERTVMVGNVQKVRNAVDENYEDLFAAAKIISSEVIKYGVSHITELAPQPFFNHRLDIVTCFSKSGVLLSYRAADFHKQRMANLSVKDVKQLGSVIQLSNKSANGTLNGILVVSGTPLQLVLMPIQNTDVLLLIGRYLDTEEVRRLMTLTQFDFDILTLSKENEAADIAAALSEFERGVEYPSQVLNNGNIAGYTLFKDLFDKPAALGMVTEQRHLYEKGKAAIAYVISALFLTGGVFCCVMLIFIRGTVLKRLESLGATVKKISLHRDITTRLEFSDEKDELTELAGSINSMLDSLEYAETGLREYVAHVAKLNNELTIKTDELAAANTELEAFNYSVSHDMRGPLTRISGYCQILLEDEFILDPQIKSFVAKIHDAGIWLNDMIDAMLRLAQLSRSGFIQESVNLTDIAEMIIRELALMEPARTVKTEIEKEVIVSGDQRLLKILMTNLLGNAWKYSSRRDQAFIEFGISETEPVPVYFVRDNGAGFNMADAEKLFRVFTRLHDPAQFSGTGVGLATVQRIVARHGGRIWAKGEPARGATFYFTLQPAPAPVPAPIPIQNRGSF